MFFNVESLDQANIFCWAHADQVEKPLPIPLINVSLGRISSLVAFRVHEITLDMMREFACFPTILGIQSCMIHWFSAVYTR